MTAPAVDLPTLQSINATASFNRWAGLSVAGADVVKAGRRQVFTRAEVHALDGERTTVVVTGETILVPLGR
jgi:acyl-coenzyme A thioesterase PaaI-like protein